MMSCWIRVGPNPKTGVLIRENRGDRHNMESAVTRLKPRDVKDCQKPP